MVHNHRFFLIMLCSLCFFTLGAADSSIDITVDSIDDEEITVTVDGEANKDDIDNPSYYDGEFIVSKQLIQNGDWSGLESQQVRCVGLGSNHDSDEDFGSHTVTFSHNGGAGDEVWIEARILEHEGGSDCSNSQNSIETTSTRADIPSTDNLEITTPTGGEEDIEGGESGIFVVNADGQRVNGENDLELSDDSSRAEIESEVQCWYRCSTILSLVTEETQDGNYPYDVEVTAEYQGATATKTFDVVEPQPNLFLNDLSPQSDQIGPGDNLNIDFELNNGLGNADADATITASSDLLSRDVEFDYDVAEGEEMTDTLTIDSGDISGSAGSYDIELTVTDSEGTEHETETVSVEFVEPEISLSGLTPDNQVEKGGTLNVDAIIENTGNADGSVIITLNAEDPNGNDAGSVEETIELDGNSETDESFSIDISDSISTGTGTVTAEMGGESVDSADFQIVDSNIAISSISTDGPVSPGGTLNVDVEYANTGGASGSAESEITIHDPDGNEITTEAPEISDLGAGETTTQTITVNVGTDAPAGEGTISAEVLGTGSSQDATFQIESSLDASVTSTNSPVSIGNPFQVDVEVQNNQASGSISEDIVVCACAPNRVTTWKTQQVSIGAGQSQTISVSLGTPFLDVTSAYDIEVLAGDRQGERLASQDVEITSNTNPVFVVQGISVPNSPVDQGNDANFEVQVKNKGQSQGDASIDLFIDGDGGSDTLSGTVNGVLGSSTNTGTITYDTSSLPTGDYTVRAEGQARRSVHEAPEETADFAVEQPPQPPAFDISVSGEGQAATGDEYTLDVTVTNNGNGAGAGTIRVDWDGLRGNDPSTFNVNLEPGSQTTEQVTITVPDSPGTYAVEATSGLATSNASHQLQVVDQRPEFNISLDGDTQTATGNEYTLEANISNEGQEAGTGTITVEWGAIRGNDPSTFDVTLEPGSYTVRDATITIQDSPGTYIINATSGIATSNASHELEVQDSSPEVSLNAWVPQEDIENLRSLSYSEYQDQGVPVRIEYWMESNSETSQMNLECSLGNWPGASLQPINYGSQDSPSELGARFEQYGQREITLTCTDPNADASVETSATVTVPSPACYEDIDNAQDFEASDDGTLDQGTLACARDDSRTTYEPESYDEYIYLTQNVDPAWTEYVPVVTTEPELEIGAESWMLLNYTEETLEGEDGIFQSCDATYYYGNENGELDWIISSLADEPPDAGAYFTYFNEECTIPVELTVGYPDGSQTFEPGWTMFSTHSELNVESCEGAFYFGASDGSIDWSIPELEDGNITSGTYLAEIGSECTIDFGQPTAEPAPSFCEDTALMTKGGRYCFDENNVEGNIANTGDWSWTTHSGSQDSVACADNQVYACADE